MPVELTTTGNKKISTLMKEFNEIYPYLFMYFWDSDRSKNPDAKGVDIEKTLAYFRTKKGVSDISLTGNKKISTIEDEFQKYFGLFVQICYTTSDNQRFFTVGDDDHKTLYALNKEKQELGCQKGIWK